MSKAVFVGIVVAALSSLGLNGQTTTPTVQNGAAEERELLMSLDRQFDTETASKGADGWVSFFAENGSMVSSTSMPTTGRDAIRKVMEPVFRDTSFSLRWKPERGEILIAGKLGFTVGRYEQLAQRETHKRMRERGSYATIWMRQPDRSWKIVLDTGSPDGPALPLD